MTVKELREALAKIPTEFDNVKVYAYSNMDEGADDILTVKLYDIDTFEDNEGTPYCQGDAPWDSAGQWAGTPAFVIVG